MTISQISISTIVEMLSLGFRASLLCVWVPIVVRLLISEIGALFQPTHTERTRLIPPAPPKPQAFRV